MYKNLVKIARLVREICSQPDIQTHTDVHITILVIALADEICYMFDFHCAFDAVYF